MSQITRVPRGLQKYLGTQAQGKNPSQLGDIVSPTLSFDQFYALEDERWYTEGAPIFAVNTTVTQVVPDGEIWLLKGMGFTHQGGTAGESYTACMGMRYMPGSNALNTVGISDPIAHVVGPASGALFQMRELPTPIPAYGGTELVWKFIDVNTASNFTSVCHVRYQLLKL